MLVLVANLGSTSFKFKLLDMPSATEVAKGAYERIGQSGGPSTHGEVIAEILSKLERKPEAIGFKAVHGGPISGAVRVTDEVIAIQEQYADIAPAHNPAYIAAMKAFAAKLPSVPQVAAFETAFHQTIPMARQVYGIPHEWTEKLGIRRYGFHGASHRYIATRVKELVPGARKVISCHLGGSSSITAIEDGKSVATSMGLTPQAGLPQNNRVGDFDTFALLKLLTHGYSVDDVLKKLGKEGGLLGISGVSNDMRISRRRRAKGMRGQSWRSMHSSKARGTTSGRTWWRSAGLMCSSSPAELARRGRRFGRASAKGWNSRGLCWMRRRTKCAGKRR